MSIETDAQDINKEGKTLKWRLFFTPLVVFIFLTFCTLSIVGLTKVVPIGIFFLIVFPLIWTKVAVKYESFWRGGLINLGWYLLISLVAHFVMLISYIEGMKQRYPLASSEAVNHSVALWIVSKIAYTIPLLFLSCFIARKVSGVKSFKVPAQSKPPRILANSILWILVVIPLLIPSYLRSTLAQDKSCTSIPSDNLFADLDQSDIRDGHRFFVSREFCFVFSYPEGWTVVESPYKGTRFRIVSEFGDSLAVGVETPPDFDQMSPENYQNLLAGTFARGEGWSADQAIPGAKLLDHGKTMIANLPAYYILNELPYQRLDQKGSFRQYVVQASNNGFLYTIIFTANTARYSEAFENFKAAIMGFVITEPPSARL